MIYLLLLALAGSLSGQGMHRPKVLLIYDMEGISGATRSEYVRANKPEYAEGRRILLNDVNAAVRGLAAGGAKSIWVQDGHASGNGAEPDLLVDQLDPRARFDFRKYPFSAYTTGLDASIDAIICVGMHARARTNGFLAHTFNRDINYRVNDVDFTETHIVAMSAARFGIPVIMVSGDDVLGSQLQADFPDLEYAVVKTAESVASAKALPPGEAQKRIEARAEAAMKKFLAGRYRAYFLPPPYRFEVQFRNAEPMAMALRFPGVERASGTSVRLSNNNYMDGYLAASTLFTAANDRLDVLIRLLQSTDEGRETLRKWDDSFWERFTNPETAPVWSKSPGTGATSPKAYYGAQ